MIVEVKEEEQKYELVKQILTGLTEWFGIPESLEEYARESKKMLVLADQLEDGTYTGFFTLKKTSESAVEIYVCGIRKEYHRQGIGRKLYLRTEEECRKQGLSYLQVKTLSPEKKDPYYLQSYEFYKACGFADLEVLPLWDEWNPCLVLIKYLAPNGDKKK